MKKLIKLFALLFITTLFIMSPAHSAVFNPTSVNELIADIMTANGNMEDDVINLVPGMFYSITAGAGGGPFSDVAGNNGLPIILPDDGSSITINGNGATIQRDPGTGPCDEIGVEFRIFQVNSGADLTLIGLTIQNGCASGDGGLPSLGGGIINFGTMTITNSALVDNEAISLGGGIYNSAGIMIITNVTIAGNRAGSTGGGGIRNINGTTTVTNGTIAGNVTLNGGGGGIFNTAIAGFTAVVELKNTLIVGNTADSGNNCSNQGTINNNGGNISDDNDFFDDCAFAFNADWNTATMLGPLQNNGGGTPTFALIPTMGPSNPAIDAITLANCTDQQTMPQPVTDDQRFFPRPFPSNGNCDVGAFELQPIGILTIEKETAPPSSMSFEFSGAPFPPDCGLDDIFFLRGNDEVSCVLREGVFTVAEELPDGFALDISCTEPPSFMTPTSVTVDIGDGDDVVCTFTNLGLAINLSPVASTNPVITEPEHTVTATVLIGGLPAEGELVEFEIISGPNQGEMSDPGEGECVPDDCVTDENGDVSWTYSGELLGTDTIIASFSGEIFQTIDSNTVEKTWIVVRNIPTISQWGLIAMAGILGLIGIYVIRRRRLSQDA